MLTFVVMLCISLTGVHCWDKSEPAVVKLNAVKSEQELFIKYPKAIPMETILPHSNDAINIQYHVGYRRSGDTLVSSAGNSSSWPSTHDVTLTLNYPKNGSGAQITFVVIAVTQTSQTGKAYVTGGGIAQRHISIILIASHTTLFNYSAYFYGL